VDFRSIHNTGDSRGDAKGEAIMATSRQAAVPSLIKAIRIMQYGGSDQLKSEQVPLPEIGPGHVLAKVRYAGVNPVDWKIREGYMKQFHPVSFPLTLGFDFAGEISAIGSGSGSFQVGDRVFGFADGTYTEFAAPAITDIAAIPEKMGFEVAAALPTSGLTALQAIRDYVRPKPGTRILIQGAAGAVGSFATQIAKAWGAQVIGTAAGEDIVYLRSLGHVQVVDYTQERFESVGLVDAVLDLIGGETATRSFAIVKKGGVMVSTVGAANAQLAERAGIRAINMAQQRSAADLAELAGLVEHGYVKPRIGEVFSLERAREAQDASQHGLAKGKILLKVA
jgi:NADPH:quinone reductase-like Zn-dependent oxidoreductase